MRMLTQILNPFAIVLLLAIPGILSGQTEKQLVPADLKQQTVVTEPVTLRKGFIRAGILLNYRIADKEFTGTGKKEYYTESTWGSSAAYNLAFQYGITDRLQAELLTEYMNTREKGLMPELNPATNTTSEVITDKKGLGFGDTHFSIYYQLVPETKYRVSLTGRVHLTIPTGEKNPKNIRNANQYDLPVGDGAYALSASLMVRSILYPYSFAGYMSYSYNIGGSKIIDISDSAENKFRFGNMIEGGVSANIHLNEWIVLANEINFYHKGNGMIDNVVTQRWPSSWAASYQPDLLFQIKKFRLGESVRIPLKGKNVPADPLYVIMIQYVF
jgi:hypothetical protein